MILSRGSSAEQPHGFSEGPPTPPSYFFRSQGRGVLGCEALIVCQERTTLQKSLVILSFHFVGELRRGPRMLLCTLIFKFKSRDGARVPSKGAADNVFRFISYLIANASCHPCYT